MKKYARNAFRTYSNIYDGSFGEIVISWKLVFQKNSILDIWVHFEYASVCNDYTKQKSHIISRSLELSFYSRT